MEVLSWGGLVSTKSSAPPSGETMRQTPKSFEVQERALGPLSPCQVWCGSDFTRRRGSQKRWVLSFLCVCLFVTLLNDRDAPDFAMKCGSTETTLIPLDRGRFVVAYPCSTFSECCQLATPLNAKVENMAKLFFPPEGDRINRSRRNLARKRRPRVCCSTPNLALIGKRGSIEEPPKMSKFAQNCGFWPPEANTMNTFRWNWAGKCRP